MSDRVASGRMPVSVGVDGYNLALARGTGFATYARTLAIALGGMGCEVDLVFGLSVPPKTPPQAREAEFFSRLSEDEGFDGRAGRKPTLRGAIKRALQLPRARTLVEVPLSGRVEMADFEERIPPFRSIWTHGNLFDVAHRHFRRYGRFLEVRMESPPEVMHWTYPLPLKLAGAKNIYTIHDLVPMILPHTTLDDKNFMHALVSRCLVEADLICTVSESSRKDILSLFGTAEEKVSTLISPAT